MSQGTPNLTPCGDEAIWQQIEQVLDEHDRFLIATHVNPDGDGLGSQIALALHLADLGKQVTILNGSPIGSQFAFLETDKARVQVYVKEVNHQQVLTSDVLIVLDTAEWSRLGRMRQVISSAKGKLVVIDHHICHQDIGDVFLSVPSACSTGELIFRLLKRSRERLNLEISRALFVALATDTGWFRFNNTTPDTLRIAAELVENGVSPPEIYRNVYENSTWDDVRFFGEMVSRMSHQHDQQVVLIELPQEILRAHDGLDTDPIIDYALSLPTTEVVLLFKQVGRDITKISFRSRGQIDIGAIAEQHGGGGHRCAAGAVIKSPLNETRDKLLDAVRKQLEQRGLLAGTH